MPVPAPVAMKEKDMPARTDVGAAISSALRDTGIEFSALSTTGVYVFGDRKSIDNVNAALNSHAQIDGICTNLRHWQEECGKLHARVAVLVAALKALDEALDFSEPYTEDKAWIPDRKGAVELNRTFARARAALSKAQP